MVIGNCKLRIANCKLQIGALVVWGVFAFAVVLPGFAAEPKPVTSIEGITEYHLDNGLKVLLFPDGSKPTVTVNLTIFVG